MTRRLRLALLAGVVSAAACSGPTGTGASDPRIAGRWMYHAAAAGTGVAVDGVLLLAVAPGGGVSGTLEAQESDATGRRAVVTGLVSGSVVAAGSVDFEVTIVGGRARQHVATLRGDSLAGDWIERQPMGAVQSGRFSAVRRTP